MKLLKNKRVLITAGPTREYIDPVRYISNDSSGQMGIALAMAAKKMGAEITLISGPTNFHLPPFEKGGRGGILNVVSARQMFAAVKKHYKSADIIIMSAAVADFRPAKFSRHKIKKNVAAKFTLPNFGRASSAATNLKLIRNPGILNWMGRNKRPHQLLIGFALETENLIKNAFKKLKEKKCDMIVANNAKTIGKSTSSVTIINKKGSMFHVSGSKKTVAEKIFKSTLKFPKQLTR